MPVYRKYFRNNFKIPMLLALGVKKWKEGSKIKTRANRVN